MSPRPLHPKCGPYITNNLVTEWIEWSTLIHCSKVDSISFPFQHFKELLSVKPYDSIGKVSLADDFDKKNGGDHYFAPFTSIKTHALVAKREHGKRKTQINIQSSSKSRNDANIQFWMLRAVRAQPLLFKIMWLYFVIKISCVSDVYRFVFMRIQNKAFLFFALFDLTENVLTVMIFERKKASSTKVNRIRPESMMKFYFYERDANAHNKKKKYWLPAWCVLVARYVNYTIEPNNHKGNRSVGRVCVCECVTCSLSSRKRFPFEWNFVVRTQFKILSKSRYSLILNIKPDQQSQTADDKSAARHCRIVLTPFKCISHLTPCSAIHS